MRELPALDRPPFPGPLGERIYDNISRYAYSLWQDQARLIINHYGLNMADPRAQEFLFEQMEAFLFDEGSGSAVTGAPVAGGKGLVGSSWRGPAAILGTASRPSFAVVDL